MANKSSPSHAAVPVPAAIHDLSSTDSSLSPSASPAFANITVMANVSKFVAAEGSDDEDQVSISTTIFILLLKKARLFH